MMHILMRLVILTLLAASLQNGLSPARAAGGPADPYRTATINARPDAAVPRDLRLTDSRGEARPLAQVLGGDTPVILAPVYYDCPNICGLTTESLLHALSGSPLRPGRDVRVVFFSFDPTEGPAEATKARQRTLSRLRAWGDAPPDALTFLTGDGPAITRLTEALGYRAVWDAELGQYAHPTAFAVLSPEGRVSRWINALAATPRDLRLAVAEAGQGTTTSLADAALLLCYQYDPQTGQYGGLIDNALKGLSALLVLSIGGTIGGLLWRERRRR